MCPFGTIQDICAAGATSLRSNITAPKVLHHLRSKHHKKDGIAVLFQYPALRLMMLPSTALTVRMSSKSHTGMSQNSEESGFFTRM